MLWRGSMSPRRWSMKSTRCAPSSSVVALLSGSGGRSRSLDQRDLARARQQILGVGGGVDHERRHHEQTGDHAGDDQRLHLARHVVERSTRRSHSAAAATNASAGGTDQ